MKYRWCSVVALQTEIKDEAGILSVADRVLEGEFAPTHYGLVDGAIRQKYNRRAIADDAGRIIERGTVYFERRTDPRYEAGFVLNAHTPSLYLDAFGVEVPESMQTHVLGAADGIFESARPRFLVVGFGPLAPGDDQGRPLWETDDHLAHHILILSSMITVQEYVLYGPLGLGLRTYFSKEFVDLIGESAIGRLPAVVSQIGHGVRVDLHNDLIGTPFNELLPRWRACDEVLAPSGIFATREVDRARKRITYRRARQRI